MPICLLTDNMFGTQRSTHWMLLLYYLLIVDIGAILTHPALSADKSDALINDSDVSILHRFAHTESPTDVSLTNAKFSVSL